MDRKVININREMKKNITDLIENNSNIINEIKNELIECVCLILNKFPVCYSNFICNLASLTVTYNHDKELERINTGSSYISETNTLILNETMLKGKHGKNLLIHKLLHIASFDGKNLGFIDLKAGCGLSLNDGVTEYLARFILKDFKCGITCYNNDINNVILLSTIVCFDDIINCYFKGGLISLFSRYINKVGKTNLRNLIVNMDAAYIKRIEKKEDSMFKDKYIKLFVEDITRLQFNDRNQATNTIKAIESFIKSQYPEKINNSLHKFIQEAKDTIYSKMEYNTIVV